MVNAELVDLCRTVIGAIQETDNFDAPTLRRLILHIVPQLLTELDILSRMLETVALPEPPPLPAPAKKRKKDKKKGRKERRQP